MRVRRQGKPFVRQEDGPTKGVTVRLTMSELSILDAIGKIRKDIHRADTVRHAIQVLFAGYKIKYGPDVKEPVDRETDGPSSPPQ